MKRSVCDTESVKGGDDAPLHPQEILDAPPRPYECEQASDYQFGKYSPGPPPPGKYCPGYDDPLPRQIKRSASDLGSVMSEEGPAKRQRALKPVVQFIAFGENGVVIDRYHVSKSDCSNKVWTELCTVNFNSRHPEDIKSISEETCQFMCDLLGIEDEPKMPELHGKCMYKGDALLDPEDEGVRILKQQLVCWFH